MAASPKEKFDAAIQVIHSLPKHGPFQPSHEMMLTFYGYFKQATEGPCNIPKPYMWEVIKKAKWDAWHKLGNMPEEEAMLNYVEELKKIIKISTEKWNEMAKNDDPRIIEAMPQNQAVGNFMEKIGSFYELVDEDSPIEGAQVPNRQTPSGSTGSTPEQSQSESSSEHDKEEELNFSQRVEVTLHKHFEEDEADAVPVYPSEQLNSDPVSQGNSLPITTDETSDSGQQPVEDNETVSPAVVISREAVSEESADQVSIDSESEEEFCDSSDKPVEEDEIEIADQGPQILLTMSTPLKPVGKQNRVHFQGIPSSDGVERNGRISPIVDESQSAHYVNGLPFLRRKINGHVSDSLVVQAPSEGSMNLTLGSQLNRSGNNTETDFSSNNSSLLVEHTSGYVSRGGEENAPTGGAQQPRGQGQVPMGPSGNSSQRQGSGMTSQHGGGRHVLLTGGSGGSGGHDNPSQGPSGYHDNLNEQIALALVRLQQDMNSVLERLARLESQSPDAKTQSEDREKRTEKRWWWPFPSITGSNVFFILVWPVLVHILLNMIINRRRRQR